MCKAISKMNKKNHHFLQASKKSLLLQESLSKTHHEPQTTHKKHIGLVYAELYSFFFFTELVWVNSYKLNAQKIGFHSVVG